MEDLDYYLDFYDVTKKDIAKYMNMPYTTFMYKTNNGSFYEDEKIKIYNILAKMKPPKDNFKLKTFLFDEKIKKNELPELLGLDSFELYELFYADLLESTQDEIIECLKNKKHYTIRYDPNANKMIRDFMKKHNIKYTGVKDIFDISKTWFTNFLKIERSEAFQEEFIEQLKVIDHTNTEVKRLNQT